MAMTKLDQPTYGACYESTDRPSSPRVYSSYNRAAYYLGHEPELFTYRGERAWGRLPLTGKLRAEATFGKNHTSDGHGRRFLLFEKRTVTQMYGVASEYDLVTVFDSHAEAVADYTATLLQYCASKTPTNKFKWL